MVIELCGFGEFAGKSCKMVAKSIDVENDKVMLEYRVAGPNKQGVTKTAVFNVSSRRADGKADAETGYEIPAKSLSDVAEHYGVELPPPTSSKRSNAVKVAKNGATAPAAAPKVNKAPKAIPAEKTAAPQSGKAAKPAPAGKHPVAKSTKPVKVGASTKGGWGTVRDTDSERLVSIRRDYASAAMPKAGKDELMVNVPYELFLIVRDTHLTAAKKTAPGYNELRASWQSAAFRGYMFVVLNMAGARYLVETVFPTVMGQSYGMRPAKRLADLIAAHFKFKVPDAVANPAPVKKVTESTKTDKSTKSAPAQKATAPKSAPVAKTGTAKIGKTTKSAPAAKGGVSVKRGTRTK